jgi:hypothetical protein
MIHKERQKGEIRKVGNMPFQNIQITLTSDG